MKEHRCLNPECNNRTTNPKYCCRSCSAKISNSKTPKRTAKSSGLCERCGIAVAYKKQKHGGHSPRKFCETCYPKARAEQAVAQHNRDPIEITTLGQLKKRRTGYWSWRVEITKHARKVYLNSSSPKKCILCGYDKHFDVCHRQNVTLYADEATVGEINLLENLVGLCRNHHWEFDHDLLDEDYAAKLEGR